MFKICDTWRQVVFLKGYVNLRADQKYMKNYINIYFKKYFNSMIIILWIHLSSIL